MTTFSTTPATQPAIQDETPATSSFASNSSVMSGSFVLMLATLLAGMPVLSLAFFGAMAGSLFSLLIDHQEDIADARMNMLEDRSFGLV